METKPFYKTSEFWLSIIAALGVLITSMADLYPGRWAAAATAIIIGLYSVARGVAKAGVPPTPPVTEPAPTGTTVPTTTPGGQPIAGGSQELDVVQRARNINETVKVSKR